MALVADEGLGWFCGLNVIPKKSYLSEYSHRIEHAQTTQLLDRPFVRGAVGAQQGAAQPVELDLPVATVLETSAPRLIATIVHQKP